MCDKVCDKMCDKICDCVMRRIIICQRSGFIRMFVCKNNNAESVYINRLKKSEKICDFGLSNERI